VDKQPEELPVKARFSWFGVVLIVVGLAMLLDHLHILTMSWWLIFWVSVAAGSAIVLVRNSHQKQGGVFWLTVLLFFALYKTLRLLGALEFHESMGVPLLLVIAGIGLVAVVLTHPVRWHLLVPAVVLIGVGGAMVLAELDVLSVGDVRTAVKHYWPVAVILFGAAMLLNSGGWKKQKQNWEV
jgi:hypothetical protein